jgi:cytochrome c biogenesis protein CcmG/thiol:disulfide interchange protein DsbE
MATMTSEVKTTSARRAPRLWLALALLILVAGGAWVWAGRVPADTLAALRIPAPAVDHPAPDFSAPLLTGESFSLSAAAGTPVVLNFWATWCGPCRAEMPAIQNAATTYGERVQFIAVNQGETPSIIDPFVDEFGLTFPIALDLEQAVGADLYNVMGMPTTFFIDGDGTIQRVWMGEMNAITLEEGIAEILN